MPKQKSPASIPHKSKPAPYEEAKRALAGLAEKEEKKPENRYTSRPPQVHEYNPNLAPNSYDPKVGSSKATLVCDAGTFGKSEVERTLKWEEEIERRDYTKDTKSKMLQKKLAHGQSRSNGFSQTSPGKFGGQPLGPSAALYFK